jgi:cyclase
MLKKRIIFTLLYNNGFFIQSRNFRRQKIGTKDWINKNYNFNYISNFIDELIILDISKVKNSKQFIKNCKSVCNKVFVPISLGGGINTYEDAKFYFNNGADKVILNTNVNKNPKILNKISDNYGSSSIIISIDVKEANGKYYVYINNGTENTMLTLENYISKISNYNFAEIYLNSIDRDGTGYGIDKNILIKLKKFNFKFIISGGLGNYKHFYQAFKHVNKVEAVATSNLLNFVGDSLKIVRKNLLKKKIDLSRRSEIL